MEIEKIKFGMERQVLCHKINKPGRIRGIKVKIAEKIIRVEQNKDIKNTLYERVKWVGNQLNIEKEKLEVMKKSSWKRRIKEKINKKMAERLHRETEGKTKSRTIKRVNEKWKNIAIRNYDGSDRKDI